MLPTALGLAGDRGVIVPGAKCPLHQLLPLLFLLGQLLEQPGESGTGTGTQWGAQTGTPGDRGQGPAKPYLPVSMRRWQSCVTSAEDVCREGRGSAWVLGLVLSPEVVLSCWGGLLGMDSLGGMGSSLSLVSLVPSIPGLPAFSPRSVGAEAAMGTEKCPMASDPEHQGQNGVLGPAKAAPVVAPHLMSLSQHPKVPQPTPDQPPSSSTQPATVVGPRPTSQPSPSVTHLSPAR